MSLHASGPLQRSKYFSKSHLRSSTGMIDAGGFLHTFRQLNATAWYELISSLKISLISSLNVSGSYDRDPELSFLSLLQHILQLIYRKDPSMIGQPAKKRSSPFNQPLQLDSRAKCSSVNLMAGAEPTSASEFMPPPSLPTPTFDEFVDSRVLSAGSPFLHLDSALDSVRSVPDLVRDKTEETVGCSTPSSQMPNKGYHCTGARSGTCSEGTERSPRIVQTTLLSADCTPEQAESASPLKYGGHNKPFSSPAQLTFSDVICNADSPEKATEKVSSQDDTVKITLHSSSFHAFSHFFS